MNKTHIQTAIDEYIRFGGSPDSFTETTRHIVIGHHFTRSSDFDHCDTDRAFADYDEALTAAKELLATIAANIAEPYRDNSFSVAVWQDVPCVILHDEDDYIDLPCAATDSHGRVLYHGFDYDFASGLACAYTFDELDGPPDLTLKSDTDTLLKT